MTPQESRTEYTVAAYGCVVIGHIWLAAVCLGASPWMFISAIIAFASGTWMFIERNKIE